MKNSEIIIKAAEHLDEFQAIKHSCIAIDDILFENKLRYRGHLRGEYERVFCPDENLHPSGACATHSEWLKKRMPPNWQHTNYWHKSLLGDRIEEHQWRLTALAFYAAMLEYDEQQHQQLYGHLIPKGEAS